MIKRKIRLLPRETQSGRHTRGYLRYALVETLMGTEVT